MLLRKLTLWLSIAFISLHTSNTRLTVDAWSFNDIGDALDDAIDAGAGLIDDISDAVSDFADSVASAFTSLGTAITGVALTAASWLYSISTESEYAIYAVYSISNLASNVIDDLLDGFNQTTWNKLSDGAKYILYEFEDLVDEDGEKLASYIKEYIAEGSNFLTDLADFDDYMPFPFDVIESDDFYTVVDCVDDLVLESAIQFAENVATTLVDLGNDNFDNFDITPLFNTEDIQDELNATYECLLSLGKELNTRESDESSDDNIISDLLDDALEYFEFDQLVHGIEIGFTACTLVCGTASIGFAVNTVTGQVAPYYVVSSGVETSSVVGASIEASWNFWPSWEAAVGTGHVVSFDASIDIPLVPIDFGTTICVSINDSGTFGGFELRNDILDVSLGLNGAFGVGYRYQSSYWIQSLTDVKNAWNAFYDVGEIAAYNVELAISAFNTLSDTLGSGGYLISTDVDNSESQSRRLLDGTNSITLTCPSTESDNAGNLSSVELGYITINEVIYGNHNFSSDTYCNSSTVYSTIYDNCAWLANCSFDATVDNLGDPSCSDSNGNSMTSYDFDIIYTCPDTNKATVFNIGCFKAQFWEIIESGYIQDGISNYDFINDNWEKRENTIAKCSKIASDAGYDGFGIYNHGMCLIGSNFLTDGIYNKYNSTECVTQPNNDGLGDPETINIYIFANDDLAFEDQGCYNTTFVNENIANKYILSMEGLHTLTQDNYESRKLAVSKCAQIANENNYDGFALLNGGACYVSNKFEDLSNAMGSDYNGTYDCGTGSGNSKSYNVYTFPYATLNVSNKNKNNELTTGAIIGIVFGVLIFIVAIVVAGVCFVKRKQNIENNHQPTTTHEGSNYSKMES